MAADKEIGHGFDGSVRLTVSVVIGLLLVIGGVALVAYNNLIIGIPVLLLGLILPIFLQLALGKKRGTR